MLPRLNKHWMIHDRITREADDALADYPPFFRQILFARGINDPIGARAYLSGSPDKDYSPFQLNGMDDAVNRLLYAVDHHELIAVYGDYDVDGVTATALLTEVLRRYGAEVMPYIPNRFDEGYGLNLEAVDALADSGVRLVVTVDCGIRSPREAERAEQRGMDLIISDHHHPSDEIPQAHAVLCPKNPLSTYPDENISGVGLAYKIAQALERRRPEAGVCADDWLDLVALGTVADVVPLQGENRVLVRRGLERMRLGKRVGLNSLINTARLKAPRLTAGDIAFMLGPRLNAAGRIDTATDALSLLMTQDLMEAGKLAQQLENQNGKRQEMTREAQEKASRQARELEAPHILFAFDSEFKAGIVGLVASRLVDTFYRPAIVGEHGTEYTRASCRSIPEFHITQALDECRDLLERHGGHAMAAGFTIRNENLPVLEDRLRAIAARELAEKDLRPVLRADLEVSLSDLRPTFIRYLEQLQPTGQANPEAVFVSRNLQVQYPKKIGTDGQHLKMRVSDGWITYDVIAFRQGHWCDAMPERIDLLYTFETNEFNGRESLQLNVRDLKPSGSQD